MCARPRAKSFLQLADGGVRGHLPRGQAQSAQRKILFISAVNEVTRERAQSFLTDDHIERIVQAYQRFKDELGLARVATLEEIHAKDGNLSIPLYVTPVTGEAATKGNLPQSNLPDALAGWLESSKTVKNAVKKAVKL